ncbi:hypothetical protein Ahy_A01g000720 isoform B [Arachis hypogaea]|uniref:Uncharacterized protein n=1 Tax=Arachis hypogaea TaxID=3818 RepID=A0A445EL63_ARAHY|nr:hypothetical protein Ahy_A01g000720 isoform B [Arachis hypogaea]
MMLKLLITERRRETSTTQVQTFCYDLFASPDNLQLQQGIPVISKWLIYNQFKFVASKGIKLGGIGSVRGYGKRAIGSGRSCPLPLHISTPLTWYALMEMGYDSPNLPIGMVTQLHLKRCEEALLEFIEKVKSSKEKE